MAPSAFSRDLIFSHLAGETPRDGAMWRMAGLTSGFGDPWFLIHRQDSFKFNPSYAKSSNFLERYRDDGLPLVLDWVVRNETCVEAQKNQTSYACRGVNSICIDRPNGSGYLCNCSQGYEGNPYLDGGCQQGQLAFISIFSSYWLAL